MFIRQAFQTFLLLQSEADPVSSLTGRSGSEPTAGRAWPLDHAPWVEIRDWTLDWRWFATDADQ